jgi:TPR repeat protein
MSALARMHLTGSGGPRNASLALELLEKAAALGDAAAMNSLGLLYLNGQAVGRDEDVAKTWFEKAAALGDQDAQSNLSRLEQALRAGYSSLGMQISARRSACAQSCRSIHRSYIVSVCERYFHDAPTDHGERRDCIDLSLRLAGQCTSSCREWAQLSTSENACQACFQTFLECSGNDTGTKSGQTQKARYAVSLQGCLASHSRCVAACQPR